MIIELFPTEGTILVCYYNSESTNEEAEVRTARDGTENGNRNRYIELLQTRGDNIQV